MCSDLNSWSCNFKGSEGFKNVKKSTSIAAQAAGTALGNVSTVIPKTNYLQCNSIYFLLFAM